ncbi:MAG: YceI family protein [Pseudomonadota bacterium]
MLKHKIIALLLAASVSLGAQAAESYTADPDHTYTHFAVNHMGFSTMYGRFDKSSGKIKLDRAAKTGSVEIAVQAASVSTGMPKRDDHLRSPDFFNAAEFPTVNYKSSAVKFNGDSPASIDGNLTLLGVTKPVTLTIDNFKCGTNPMNKKEQCGANASAQIKRSDFGMKAYLPGVGDDIKLVFEIEAYKD